MLDPWVAWSVSLPSSCPFISTQMWDCEVGQPLPRQPAAALPTPLHNPPPHWVCQSPSCCKSSPPRLSISAPPTGLDECFFFISLVVGLPCSSIFCQFWMFFVFKLLLSFWLCEEAQCVYLRLQMRFFKNISSPGREA